MSMKLKISEGNSKLGKIPNISLPPGTTCLPGAPCYDDGCYARKLANLWKSAREAWENNLKVWEQDPKGYFTQLDAYFCVYKPPIFRFHVAGDIPSMGYYFSMARLCERFQETKVLCFTKRPDLVRESPPPNLKIVLSRWPGMALDNPMNLPEAWLSCDPDFPLSAFPCPGRCWECAMCWRLQPGDSVVFGKH